VCAQAHKRWNKCFLSSDKERERKSLRYRMFCLSVNGSLSFLVKRVSFSIHIKLYIHTRYNTCLLLSAFLQLWYFSFHLSLSLAQQKNQRKMSTNFLFFSALRKSLYVYTVHLLFHILWCEMYIERTKSGFFSFHTSSSFSLLFYLYLSLSRFQFIMEISLFHINWVSAASDFNCSNFLSV
jgi:hypothetical protein